MKNSFLLLIAISGVFISNANAQKNSGALDKTKPTIYIEYVRVEVQDPSKNEPGEKLIWLRLKNNCKWGIRLDMSGGRDKGLKDVRLYYDIVGISEKIVEKNRCHVCSTNILRSGKSLLFALPYESLSPKLLARINFSFEWEDDLKVAAGFEPLHYVVFDGDLLPEQ